MITVLLLAEVDPIVDSVDSVDIIVVMIVTMAVSVSLICNNNHTYSCLSLIINHRNFVTIFLQ